MENDQPIAKFYAAEDLRHVEPTESLGSRADRLLLLCEFSVFQTQLLHFLVKRRAVDA